MLLNTHTEYVQTICHRVSNTHSIALIQAGYRPKLSPWIWSATQIVYKNTIAILFYGSQKCMATAIQTAGRLLQPSHRKALCDEPEVIGSLLTCCENVRE